MPIHRPDTFLPDGIFRFRNASVSCIKDNDIPPPYFRMNCMWAGMSCKHGACDAAICFLTVAHGTSLPSDKRIALEQMELSCWSQVSPMAMLCSAFSAFEKASG